MFCSHMIMILSNRKVRIPKSGNLCFTCKQVIGGMCGGQRLRMYSWYFRYNALGHIKERTVGCNARRMIIIITRMGAELMLMSGAPSIILSCFLKKHSHAL